MQLKLANHIENILYNSLSETRVKCNASRSGLGGAPKQLMVNGRKPISFASRFTSCNGGRYRVNEFNLQKVDWSIEYLKKTFMVKNS